ncbi:MAG: hypothetical protein RJB38_527 [Pseudomonadota bacterium]
MANLRHALEMQERSSERPVVLEARELIKDYPKLRAVDGVSISLRAGICFGLLGPNGAGKTTTIEMLEGVTTPTSGAVLFRGQPAGDEFRARSGIQFQATALQDFLKVSEVLSLFRNLYDQQGALAEIIELTEIGEFLDRETDKLSGGQRQRMLLAVALVNDPEVLFLDEPTTGLDPQARRAFWEMVHRLKKRGKTIVMTTHYMEEAYELCDEIAIMDRGRIIARGEPDALLQEHFQTTTLVLPRAAVAGREALLASSPVFGHDGTVVRETDSQVEIQTLQINAVLGELLRLQRDLSQLQVRSPTLDDLFLRLTGRELRE